MKLIFRSACVALLVGLGACRDQGPDRFRTPVDVPLVPEMVAKFANIPYTFANGDFFEPRFAGAPMRLTFTSGTTFRAEGNGKVWEGTVTYPTATSSVAALRALSAEPSIEFVGAARRAPNVYLFGTQPAVSFAFVGITFQSNNAGALRFNNVVSDFHSLPRNFDFQACIVGVAVRVGPYGTFSAAYNPDC